MPKYIMVVETPPDWNNIEWVKGNIEEEFPGWKIKWIAFCSDFIDHQCAIEVATEYRNTLV